MLDALSRHEWVVMEALWQHQPMFLSEIIHALSSVLPWKRATYLTYLKRMCEKGYVGFTEIRGSRSYYPIISREACVRNESQLTVSKMTDDSARLFLACLIKDTGLSDETSDELQKLIDSLTQKADEPQEK